MVDYQPGRRGRPTGGGDARARLVTLARRHLEAGDLATTSSRALAEEAGVSHSVVNFHFGSRAGLLAAAAAVPVAPHDIVAASLRADGTLDLDGLLHRVVTLWEHPRHRERLLGLARGAADGGPASAALAGYLEDAVLARLEQALGRERGRSVALVIVGTLFARYVVRLPSLTRLTPSATVRAMRVAIGERGGV